MRIMVVDGQGGGIGRSLVERLRAELPGEGILAVGTNSTATANMMRGGATAGVTGENALLYNAPRAQVIVGPIGIVLANAILGEISPKMACAISDSPARKILIPSARCNLWVAGMQEKPLTKYLEEAVEAVKAALPRA